MSVFSLAPLRLHEKNYCYLFGRSWPETGTFYIVTLGEQTNEQETELTGKIWQTGRDYSGFVPLPFGSPGEQAIKNVPGDFFEPFKSRLDQSVNYITT
ncbi:hypothetical protein N9112_01085 [bacterium]|nr:hypothetical protein [bacterium]